MSSNGVSSPSAPFRSAAAFGISRLQLTDFRNYAAAHLTLAADQGVVLFGPNGAGKSNLLEAVSYLGAGRGLRGAKLDVIDRSPGGGPWAVAGELQTPDGSLMVGSGRIMSENGSSRRAIRINGLAVARAAALARRVAVLWLTPDMDHLLSGSGERRRRFLDRLATALSPDHTTMVAAYERSLRERGKLLRDYGPGADPAWLAALERRMAESGVVIAVTRRDAARRLEKWCARCDGSFPGPRIVVSGEVEDWIDEEPALAVEERLQADLAASRTRDAISGGAAVGPHRSDWTAFDRCTGRAAAQCSTGEQKAFLISLVLAAAQAIFEHCSVPPLLLLDEVVAHLDEQRRQALFDCLLSTGGQFWLTGTDEEDFSSLIGRAQFLRVEAGRVAPFVGSVPAMTDRGEDSSLAMVSVAESPQQMEG